MKPFELYVFFICLFVFIGLTTLCTILITKLVQYYLRLVAAGEEDEKITKQFQKTKRKICFGDILGAIFSGTVCFVLCILFVFACISKITEDNYVGNTPSIQVVKSDSMSYQHNKNKYLTENSLDNQFKMFDLLITYKLPAEEELKLYDIVIYEHEKTGQAIIHRIVGIEEPNETHPNCRYFLLQGDAVGYQDDFPVLYTQMRGIYYDDKIENLGSFIMFMQSPAGYLCIFLILFCLVVSPLVERKVYSAQRARWEIIRRFGKNNKKSNPHKSHALLTTLTLLAVGGTCLTVGYGLGIRFIKKNSDINFGTEKKQASYPFFQTKIPKIRK